MRELEAHVEGRETWRVLEVTYPEGVPAHTKVQKLYFGDDLTRGKWWVGMLTAETAMSEEMPHTVRKSARPSHRSKRELVGQPVGYSGPKRKPGAVSGSQSH
jgi:hypothetical protein